MSDRHLTKFEVEVLKELNGEPNTIQGWGAALGVAVGFLRGMGYAVQVNGAYKITPAGRIALERAKEEQA